MPSDTKRVAGAPYVIDSLRAKVLVQIQSVRSGAVPESGIQAAFAQMLKDVDAAANPTPPAGAGAGAAAGKKGTPAPAAAPTGAGAGAGDGDNKPQLPASVSNAICETLLDMSRCAWSLGLRQLAVQYSDRADLDAGLSPSIRVKSDLCKVLLLYCYYYYYYFCCCCCYIYLCYC
jgi:hypothetical protein